LVQYLRIRERSAGLLEWSDRPMKITSVVAHGESRPRAELERDAIQTLDTQGVCRVTIQTDEGLSGSSSTGFARLDGGPSVMAALVNEVFAPAIVGEDPFMIRAIRDKLTRLTDYLGTVGLATWGLSAIDTALWDLLGRSVGQPVWRLLGAQRDRVPTYATVGWLNYDLDTLVRTCVRAAEHGFRGVKVKVGTPTLSEDVLRIETVQRAIGPTMQVMVDANQAFTVAEALRRGRVYEEMGCTWYEEPVRSDDVDGMAHLAQALTIPIAAGENSYGKRQFRTLLERRAVDIVQPDLRRAGGITECLEIGLMADAFNVPYASHAGGVHIHVLAALPNTLYVEGGLQMDGTPPRLVDGCMLLPQGPGFSAE
jgi:L-alanine-DL-glutamate epimerase-like enolase superfamily enzyme